MEYNFKWNGRTIDNVGRHHLLDIAAWTGKSKRDALLRLLGELAEIVRHHPFPEDSRSVAPSLTRPSSGVPDVDPILFDPEKKRLHNFVAFFLKTNNIPSSLHVFRSLAGDL